MLTLYSLGPGSFVYGQNQVIDILSGKKIRYESKYIDLKNNKMNFFDVIEFNYPQLTGLGDSTVQKKLNTRFREIIINQLVSDSFRVKLFVHVQNSLSTYFSIHSKVKDQLGLYQNDDFKFTPSIEEADYRFLSYADPILTFSVNYKYKARHEGFTLDEDLTYIEVYYFNINTGKEYRPRDVFLPSLAPELQAIIETDVVSKYKDFTVSAEEMDSETEEEEDEEGDVPYKAKEKKLVDFSLSKDGFAYPAGFSFAYYIPQFTPCTKNVYGLEVAEYFSFGEIQKYLNPNGPFAGLKGQSIKNSTSFKNLNNPLYTIPNNIITPQVPGYDYTAYTAPQKIKTISLKREVPVRTSTGEFEKKEQLFRQLTYNEQGYLLQVKNYEYDGRLYTTEVFSYNRQKRLIKKTLFQNGKILDAEDYQYDNNGNLLLRIRTGEDEIPEKTSYYYSGNYFIEEDLSGQGSDGTPENTFRKKTLNASGQVDTIYYVNNTSGGNSVWINRYDKNKRLTACYNGPGTPSDGQQYVYDKNGNMLTYERDQSRYLYEYKYDLNNNLVQETRYDSQRKVYTKKITYTTNGLPDKITIQEQSSSDPQVILLSYETW